MTNLAKWANGAGQGLTWGNAFNGTAGGSPSSDYASFNSLANGSVVVSTLTIANGTPLDLYADLSFSLVGTIPASGQVYFAAYLLPLNQDGSTYGDGTTTGSLLPAVNYSVGSASFTTTGTSGSKTFTGMFRGIILPPGSFRFALANLTQNALSSSASPNVSYRTYDENLNG